MQIALSRTWDIYNKHLIMINHIYFVLTIIINCKHITNSLWDCLLCRSGKIKALRNKCWGRIFRIEEKKRITFKKVMRKALVEERSFRYLDPKQLYKGHRKPHRKKVSVRSSRKQNDLKWNRVEVKKILVNMVPNLKVTQFKMNSSNHKIITTL